MRQNGKGTILSWIKDFPIKAMLTFLLVVLPVVIIIIAFTTFNKNGKRFYFDKTEEKITYLYTKDLSSNKEIEKYLDLDLELKRITYKMTDENEVETASYSFKLDYTLSDEYKNRDTNVSFRWILKADWIKDQSVVKNVNSSSTSNSSINFDYHLPVRKHLFFNITYPNLFLELKIETKTSASGLSTSETETLYYKYDISKAMKNNNTVEIIGKTS